MRKHYLTVLLLATVLTSAEAAGVVFYNSASIPDDSVAEILPEVIVDGNPRSASLKSRTPLVLLTGKNIKERGVVDISDALRRLPGLTIKDYGGAGGMKSVSVRGLGAQHTTVVYDGVAVSNGQTGEVDLSRYPIDNIGGLKLFASDRDDIFVPAKVANSSSSLLIESNPISLIGRNCKLNVRFKTGSFGLVNPLFNFSTNLGNGWRASIFSLYSRADNEYPFKLINGNNITKEKRSNSKMAVAQAEANIGWKGDNGANWTNKVSFYDNRRQLPGQVIYYVNSSNEKLHERNIYIQSRGKRNISDAVSIQGTVKFDFSSTEYEDFGEKYPNGHLDNHYWQKEFYFTGSALYRPLEWLTCNYSADWSYNTLSSNLPNGAKPRRNTILQSAALKCEWLKLSLMARIIHSVYINKEATDYQTPGKRQRLSPALSLSYHPLRNLDLNIRASYKNIFRMPTFSEDYFSTSIGTGLKPELTDQFNLGIAYGKTTDHAISSISLTCDGYLNRVKDKIIAVPVNMFLWSMTNLGRADILGLDMTLESEIILGKDHKIVTVGSYSLQYARSRTSRDMSDWNKQIAYIPVNSGSASISWFNPWVDVALSMTGCGAKYTTNANIPETRINGYSDFGIQLSKDLTWGQTKFDLTFQLSNIFDSQYEIIARYPMPGRRFTFCAAMTI